MYMHLPLFAHTWVSIQMTSTIPHLMKSLHPWLRLRVLKSSHLMRNSPLDCSSPYGVVVGHTQDVWDHLAPPPLSACSLLFPTDLFLSSAGFHTGQTVHGITCWHCWLGKGICEMACMIHTFCSGGKSGTTFGLREENGTFEQCCCYTSQEHSWAMWRASDFYYPLDAPFFTPGNTAPWAQLAFTPEQESKMKISKFHRPVCCYWQLLVVGFALTFVTMPWIGWIDGRLLDYSDLLSFNIWTTQSIGSSQGEVILIGCLWWGHLSLTPTTFFL